MDAFETAPFMRESVREAQVREKLREPTLNPMAERAAGHFSLARSRRPLFDPSAVAMAALDVCAKSREQLPARVRFATMVSFASNGGFAIIRLARSNRFALLNQ